jgi:hypothetical protein
MYDEIEEINELTEQLKNKINNLEMEFNANLWDYLKGKIFVHDDFSDSDIDAEIVDVNDDGVHLQVSTKEIMDCFIEDGLELVVEDEYGNDLDFERQIDGSTVALKVDTTQTIEDAVEQRVKAQEQTECGAMAVLLKELGVKSLQEAKQKIAVHDLMEKIIATPIG